MAWTILDRMKPSAQLGQQLGTGLGEGLKLLAEHKLGQIRKSMGEEKIAKGLQALNIPPEQAQALAGLDASLLAPIIKQKAPAGSAYTEALRRIGTGEQIGEIPEGITGEQASNLIKIQSQRQKAIEAANKPYREAFTKRMEFKNNIESIVDQMIDLLETGQVVSGIRGRLPQATLNHESRQFESLGKELALAIAGNKGQATGFKIRMAEESKPNITQPTETQWALLENLRKKLRQGDMEQEAYDAVIGENKGLEPANLEGRVRRFLKDNKQAKRQQGLSLPYSDVEEGSIWQEDDGSQYIFENGEWRPYQGGE